MKFWQSLAFVEMDQMLDLAQFCEELGFYGVSYGDHLVTTKEQVDAYEYRDSGEILWNPETHWPDPWVLSAALAQVTTKLRFLTTIYVLPLRELLTVAKALSTAAHLSSDRVILGAGVGWQKAEFEMVAQNFHTRGKRTDEMLDILPQLMSGKMTSHHGKHYQIPLVQMSPAVRKPIPIMIGGYSDAAMRRACRFDGWMAITHEEEELYPLLQRLQSFRDSEGSENKPFDVWSGIKNPTDGTHERLAEAGVTMVNGTNFLSEDGRTMLSSIDAKKRRIEAFAKQFL